MAPFDRPQRSSYQCSTVFLTHDENRSSRCLNKSTEDAFMTSLGKPKPHVARRPLCPIHCAKQFQSQNKIRIKLINIVNSTLLYDFTGSRSKVELTID